MVIHEICPHPYEDCEDHTCWETSKDVHTNAREDYVGITMRYEMFHNWHRKV